MNTSATLLHLLLASLLTSLSSAHQGFELGPNGGRILEFSTDETLHGEVTIKAGQFHIALLDHEMKPLATTGQTLSATSGTRQKPIKLAVTQTPTGFTLPLVPTGQWLILQLRPNPAAKPITARLEYNTENCSGCNQPEWLCQCPPAPTESPR
jgi:hypothetical protein